MTDHVTFSISFGKNNSPHSEVKWRKQQTQGKWRSVFAVFIFLILFLAIINGVLKTISFGKYLKNSKGGSGSSFSALLGTEPAALFVYNKEAKNVDVFRLDENTYIETGNSDKPVVKLEDLDKKNTDEFLKTMSLTFRTKLANYMAFRNVNKLNEENLGDIFKSYSTIATPFKIIYSGKASSIENTNITRIEQLKLWWQLKSLRVESVKMHDLGKHEEEIVLSDSSKVLGVDNKSLIRQLREYLEDPKVVAENYEIEINNYSGQAESLSLASDFISVIGARVVNLNNFGTLLETSTILATDVKSATSSNLAKIFDCDINGLSNEGQAHITVNLGKDFAYKYFK